MSRTLNRCWQTAQKLVFNHVNQLSNVEFKPNQVKYVKNYMLPFNCVIDVIVLTMRITSHIYVMDNKAGDSKHFNNRRVAAITLNVTSSWAPIRSRIKCLIWAQWTRNPRLYCYFNCSDVQHSQFCTHHLSLTYLISWQASFIFKNVWHLRTSAKHSLELLSCISCKDDSDSCSATIQSSAWSTALSGFTKLPFLYPRNWFYNGL